MGGSGLWGSGFYQGIGLKSGFKVWGIGASSMINELGISCRNQDLIKYASGCATLYGALNPKPLSMR